MREQHTIQIQLTSQTMKRSVLSNWHGACQPDNSASCFGTNLSRLASELFLAYTCVFAGRYPCPA
jgi:hypothetical protein